MSASMRRPSFRMGWELLNAEYEYFREFHAFMTVIVSKSSSRSGQMHTDGTADTGQVSEQ
jgi:hypothetical protein